MTAQDDGRLPRTGAGEHDELPAWCWVASVAGIAGLLAQALVAATVSPTAGTLLAWVAAALVVAVAVAVRRRRVRLVGPGRWAYVVVAVVGAVVINLLVHGRAYGAALAALVVTVTLIAGAVGRLRHDTARSTR